MDMPPNAALPMGPSAAGAGGPGELGMPPGGPLPEGGTPPGGPMGAPMSQPNAAEGLKAGARVNVTMAIDILQQALPAMGAATPEGQAVLNALKTLTKAFGKTEAKSRELIPAEVMQLLSGLPQTNPNPGMKAGGARPVPGVGAPPLNV